jgi:hypothetical protein
MSIKMSLSRCEATLKTRDSNCKNKALYLSPSLGTHLCGVHIPKEEKNDDNLISGKNRLTESNLKKLTAQLSSERNSRETPNLPCPGNTSSGSVGMYREILRSIIAKLDAGANIEDLSESDEEKIRKLHNGDAKIVDIVMKRAFDQSGSRGANIDFDGIAKYIPSSLASLERCAEEEVIYVPSHLTIQHINLESMTLFDDDTGSYLVASRPQIIRYDDVNIKIANCMFSKISKLKEWLADENNIYMGPSDIFEGFPKEDSPWFIPLPEKYMLRSAHNAFMVQKILEDIKQGKETKEKYLDIQGKTLGCVCTPYPCHCEIYVEVVRKLLEHSI